MNKRKNLKEKGITLVALAITIIIILILAGVTLTTALGQNGLFQRAKIAVKEYELAQKNEEDKLSEIVNQLDNLKINQPKEKTTGPNGKPLPKTVTGTNHDDVEGEDRLGNSVVIPGGFRFAGDENDTVQDGIIIEDEDKNQFVWIPVSNTDGDNNEGTNNQKEEDLIKLNNGTKVEITLGRYTFNATDGTPTLMQAGNNYEEIVPIGNFQETSSHPNGGTPAKDMKGFVDSIKKNHGYYIARYEVGKVGDKIVSKEGIKVWNSLTQSSAATSARNMYNENKYVESDLINSYGWDTAIVYIQKMGHNNYANQTCGTNINYQNAGETGDEKCHIFDMAGNVSEWSTEYSKESNTYPCVSRGGLCNSNKDYTAYRYSREATESRDYFGFRPLIYLV